MYWAMGDVNFNGSSSALDLVLMQNEILNQNVITSYARQKAAALDGNSTTTLSAQDVVILQNFILGYRSWNETINDDQWLALADANGNGALDNLVDDGATYLPTGSTVWGNDGKITRPEFTTEIQKTCSMIDNISSELILYEYDVWSENI